MVTATLVFSTEKNQILQTESYSMPITTTTADLKNQNLWLETHTSSLIHSDLQNDRLFTQNLLFIYADMSEASAEFLILF